MRQRAAHTFLVAGFAIAQMQSFGQIVTGEPDKQEIKNAYRSKAGGGSTIIPGVQWERWTIKDIRGWSVKFKRLHEDRALGILTRRYQATARKADACAEYQVIERHPLAPNTRLPSSLAVETFGVKACS